MKVSIIMTSTFAAVVAYAEVVPVVSMPLNIPSGALFNMDDARLNLIIDEWILYQDMPKGEEREKHWWAVEQVMDWDLKSSGDPEMLWQFILKTYKRKLSDRALGNLAAGPLEELISKFGSKYIDRIEKLAREDEQFNYLLGGVWQLNATPEIWSRVERVRKTVW